MYDAASLTFAKPQASMRFVNYRKISDKVYDITAVLSSKTANRDDTAVLFRETMKGSAALVAGTFRVIDAAKSVVRFAGRRTQRVKNFADAASMTHVGNNQFVDTAEQIWSVKEDGSERFLVSLSSDDIEELLKESVSRMSVASSYMANPVKASVGDYAAVVDDEGSLSYGFVGKLGDKNVIYNTDRATAQLFDEAHVVESLDLENERIDAANLSGSDMKAVFDYLSKIYPPEYIKRYKEAVGH